MNSNQQLFIRKIGSLRIYIKQLKASLRESNLDSIELTAKLVEQTLLELLKINKSLTTGEKILLSPVFTATRQEALEYLEISRRILDECLEAMQTLVNEVQRKNQYGTSSNNPTIFDKKA